MLPRFTAKFQEVKKILELEDFPTFHFHKSLYFNWNLARRKVIFCPNFPSQAEKNKQLTNIIKKWQTLINSHFGTFFEMKANRNIYQVIGRKLAGKVLFAKSHNNRTGRRCRVLLPTKILPCPKLYHKDDIRCPDLHNGFA